MTLLLAVPVKDLVNAKQRLIPALSPSERRELARAMLEDVLDAAAAALPGAVLVVTTDPEVQAVARARGVECLTESANRGHTAAVAFAQREAVTRGVARFLTIPGDVPCVTAQEIAALCDALEEAPGVVFVPSRSGLGTNAALLAPPDAIPLTFGEPSFENHLKTARAAGPDPASARAARDRPRRGCPRRSARAPRARARHPERAAPPRLPGGSPSRGGPLAMPPRYEVIGVGGLPEFRPGDDVAALIVDAARRQDTPIAARDLLVISQKIVSKAEGRLVRLSDVTPSPRAQAVAEEIGRDPRLVEVILRESRRIVRQAKGVLIVETHHGFVCANAGVDQSNVDADTACLLPEDSDRSAAALRERLQALTGHELAVIIADTFGRPWREGLVNVAVGLAGFEPIRSYLGELDPAGYVLQATILALADELAGRGRAGDGQARPHSGGDHPRARLGAGRRLEPRPASRSGPRPVPITQATCNRFDNPSKETACGSASWAAPARKAWGSGCAGRRPGTR